MTRTISAAVLAFVLAAPTMALAEPPAEPARLTGLSTTRLPSHGPIASAAARLAAEPAVQNGSPVPTSGRRGRAARKVIGGIAGGVGGFFAGGFIGAKIEPNCGCDDPGLKGFLIGAPIGAALGAVVGAMVD